MLLADPVKLRQVMLRLMLGALAASGALAVLAVLIPHQFEPERMIGTAVATAVASALLFWAARLLDSDKNRPTGLFCLSIVIIQYILTLLYIWNPLSLANDADDLGWSALLFPVAFGPACGFFHMGRRAGGLLSGWAGLIFCAASYFFYLVAIWVPQPAPYTVDHLWLTGLVCLFLAFILAACLAGAGVNRHHWRWAGVGAALVAFVFALGDIWSEANLPSNTLIIAATAAALFGYTNVMFLLPLKSNQLWVRWITVLTAWISGGLYDYIAIAAVRDDFPMRVSIAASVCAGCGTIAIGLLDAFNRRTIPVREILELKEITFVCPACQKKQTVRRHDSAVHVVCADCGLQIEMQLRLPRCPKCDYSLLMNKSDRCPECGTPLTQPATLSLDASSL